MEGIIPQISSDDVPSSFSSSWTLTQPYVGYGAVRCALAEGLGIGQALYCQTMDAFKWMLQRLLLEDLNKFDLVLMLELMEPWIESEVNHVRENAVESATTLLKFLVSNFNLDFSLEFGQLTHLIALLLARATDPEDTICTSAAQAVSCLYKLMFSQKAEPPKRKRKRLRWAAKRRPQKDKGEDSHWCIVEGPEDPLFSMQLTSLLLAILSSLPGSNAGMQGDFEEVLQAILQNHARKVKRIKEVVVAIYTCLQVHPNTHWVRKLALKVLGYLLPHHLEKVVHSCLSFSLPVNRQARELWTAMASGPQVAKQVLRILLESLQVKDCCKSNEKDITTSLAAMNVIYESFGILHYITAMMEMHHQFFIPVLRQVEYVQHLALPKALQARKKEFMSKSVEIMKGLFLVAKDWAVFARVQVQEGWTMLGTPGKFFPSTHLLARAMKECDSPQMPGVRSQAIQILNCGTDSKKEKMAMALMAEFLKSPPGLQPMDRSTVRHQLKEAAASSSLVLKDLFLEALKSFAEPQEVEGLQDQLPKIMESIFSGPEQDILEGLKEMIATLHDLDDQGIGALILELAMNIRSFFDDERTIVRYSAFTLLGELLRGVSEADKVLMEREVVFSLLPLLLHLMDRDSTVSTSCRLALLDCGLFLGWTELPLIFRSLAWEDLQSCLSSIWKYLMGNHSDSAHVFLSQALQYLHHSQAEIKHAAAEFTGYILTSCSSELSKRLEQEDIVYLRKVFQELHKDRSLANFSNIYATALQNLSATNRLSSVEEKVEKTPEEEKDSMPEEMQPSEASDSQTTSSIPPLEPLNSPLPEDPPMQEGKRPKNQAT